MLSFIKFAELSKNWQEAKALFAHVQVLRLPPAGVMQRIEFTSAAASRLHGARFYA